MREYLQLLRNRDFFLLWFGQGVSEVGNKIHYIVLIWLVTQLTGSASGLSLLFIIVTLPIVLAGPLAGVLVESWPKRTVIVAADTVRGLLAFGLAFTDRLAAIYILTFLASLAATFFGPAIRTAIPRMVDKERLMTANALSSLTTYTAMLVGPALGGVFIGVYGVKTAFIINGVSFLFSAATEMFISIPAGQKELDRGRSGIFSDLREGWQYIRANAVVRFVVAFFAVCMIFFSATYVLQVVLFSEVFNFSPEEFGLLMALYGAGMVAGTLYMGKCGGARNELKYMVYAVSLIGMSYILLAFSPLFWGAAFLFSAMGSFSSVVNISYITYLQKTVTDEVRSRVFSFDMAISEVVGMAAFALAGVAGDLFGAANVIAFSGFGLFITGAVSTRFSVFRRNTV